ncbi:bifunctional diguanylate cyclase/phosphodiesterase [Sulfurimonas sp.]|uniref:bifunctional diguanylate cyclase/phosphodiesterase n=1 Tax=Sulfurimonas sp. TaxID=2022749 RepID=UPI002B49084A|nr:EAL domain-containing protein [Sulfurimonas sp.]
MKTINDIWTTFYLMFFGSFILILTLLTFSYSDIKNRHYSELENYSKIISNAIHSKLLQDDMILTIIGNQLLDNDNYKDKQRIIKLFDELLEQNQYYVALSLADIEGNFMATSSNIKAPENFNFLENKKTVNGLKKALKTKKMIVGRTYYFKNINEWIIPIRKAILNKDGKIIAVMTIGLRNKTIINELGVSQDKTILIIKDYNSEHKLYRQYMSKIPKEHSNSIYNTNVPEIFVEILKKEFKKKYDLSLDDLMNSERTISLKLKSPFNKNIIAGITYNKEYKLWILVEDSDSLIISEFFNTLFIYFTLFVASFIVFYFLFKRIAMSDRKKQDELVFQAQHDSLTKLPNRTFMYAHIEEWKIEYNKEYFVLYLDLDNFKNINDKFGHTVGDKILIEVAHRLGMFFNEGDMLIRQGGDEFIILKECVDANNNEERIQSLIGLISQVYHIDTKEFRIGVSVGIAKYPADAEDIEELLSIADTAMYEAKKRKNSYCFFSETMRHNNIVKTDIEQELRSAVEKDELWMVYQPQIKADGKLYGVEALVRWKNEKLGFVGPDKFIPIAEDTGIIRELGAYIIETSLAEIASVKKELNLDFSLSINISVVQLMEANFLVSFLKQIEIAKIDKSSITLEITESVSMEKLDDILNILYDIKEHDIKISLDDFGTGYSSLSILRELPIDELKIDKSFIDKILYDDNEKALVQSIINIGKNFNMKTLAEGVESDKQVQDLKEANCDIFQGYYYSKPLTKEHLLEYLKD